MAGARWTTPRSATPWVQESRAKSSRWKTALGVENLGRARDHSLKPATDPRDSQLFVGADFVRIAVSCRFLRIVERHGRTIPDAAVPNAVRRLLARPLGGRDDVDEGAGRHHEAKQGLEKA